jgi:predicted RNA-binding Zn ribbon-like protein
MVSSTSRRPFEFVANHIVLDYTNTVNGRPDFTRDDLVSTDDIIDWACAAGLVDRGADAMRRAAVSSDRDAAVALRECLYEVFSALASGDKPSTAASSFVTHHAAEAIRSANVVRTDFGFGLRWEADSIESVVNRLADEAVQLLRSPNAGRIRACDGCGWLFLDTSRAHGRRWCSMNTCGARHKMRRYHQRQINATSSV